MSRLALIVAVVVIPATASADTDERQSFVLVQGGYSMSGPPEATVNELVRGPLVGMSLAWDRAPPAYLQQPDARSARAELVPEATIQVTGREGTLLGGVRLQLALSENQVGLFRMSSRGKMWLAPRAGVGTQARGAVLGGDWGFAFNTGGVEIGGWIGVYTWTSREASDVMYANERVLQAQFGMSIATAAL